MTDTTAAPSATDVLLQVRDLGVTFGSGPTANVALEGIDLDVRAGEFITIVGASGSGKTTLLRAVDGLIKPTAGEVRLRDEPVTGPGKERGFVFQADSLLPWRTIRDNVAFGLEVQGMGKAERRTIAEEMLEMTGLEGTEDQYPAELSGGMRQRVNLARALATDPEVLLMDEPFAALDAQTKEVLQSELLKIWEKRQKTVLFVTHQLDEAVYLADRVVILGARPGRIREILDIDIPRPRPLDVKHTAAFAEKVDRVWQFIKKEVMHASRI